MRYGIIADIHGNLEALLAVLEDIEAGGGVDEFWCLGDIVGYGPEPGKCIDVVKRLNPVCVAGNHDRAVIGKVDLSFFNPLAAEACRWTASQLSAGQRLYLEELPLTAQSGSFWMVHGSPSEPLMEYVITTGIAERNFSFFRQDYCLVGHSHVPGIFKKEEGRVTSMALTANVGVIIGGARMIINPGGVGQPRDGDPRASYAIYDTEGNMLRLHRVEYDIEATQQQMLRAGLPIPLATRLQEGR